MDDFLKEALDIVKAQASVRTMTEEEITSMVQKLSKDLRMLSDDDAQAETLSEPIAGDAKKTIREKTITCMECGKSFKILTKKHLASHGLTPLEYREKYGLKKTSPLVCKSLQRERRRKMKDMKLWEKRRRAAVPTEE